MNRPPLTLSRWRAAVVVGGVVAAGLALAVSRAGIARYAHALAARSAVTVAAYLPIVTPAARGGSDYDLGALLIQARALATLPEWTPDVEVYHGTAPLLHATARPLSALEFDRLRRTEAIAWHDAAALAPLRDHEDWEVVGGVGVRAPELGPPWFGGWALPALVIALVLAGRCAHTLGRGPRAERRARAAFWVGGVVLGIAAYADVHAAARRSMERWLTDTRTLVQEASRMPERPGLAALGRIVDGGELMRGDSGSGEAVPGAVQVRLGAERSAELRAPAGAGTDAVWLVGTLGAGLLGPLVAWLAAWGARARRHPRRFRETMAAWGYVAPAVVHLALCSLAPLLFALYLSVHRWSLADSTRGFVGLANFARVTRDPLVWIAVRNTVVYGAYVPASMLLGLAVALVLREVRRGRGVWRALLLLPAASSVVGIALMWERLYGDGGPITQALRQAGLRGADWLAEPGAALPALMIMSVWVQFGVQAALFEAGLRTIPEAYGDAARLEGASAWQRFARITVPLLKPLARFGLVIGGLGAVQMFTYVYVLTGGGPLHSTEVLAYRAYVDGWRTLDFGSAAALATLLAIPCVVLARGELAAVVTRAHHA